MAVSDSRAWLVAYDIASRKRLARLHRFLKKKAVPVQYSVFRFEGSAMQLGRLVAEIEDYIDPSADDVRVYQVPRNPLCHVLGPGFLPDGALLDSVRSSRLPLVLNGREDWYDEHGSKGEPISVD